MLPYKNKCIKKDHSINKKLNKATLAGRFLLQRKEHIMRRIITANNAAYQQHLELRYNLFLVNTFVKITVSAIVIFALAVDILLYLWR